MDDEGAARIPFEVWIDQQNDSTPGLLHWDKAEIKLGPRVYKSASLSTYGDESTGEARHQQLTVASYRREEHGPGFEFTNPKSKWYCEGEEITRLKDLLNRNFPETGQYVPAGGGSPVSTVIEELEGGGVDRGLVAKLARALATMPESAEVLADLDEAALLASVIDRVRQRAVVKRLREAVNDPSTNETQLQKLVQNEPWLFGGRYVRAAKRRTFVAGEQLDIPLIRSDGSMHVVELKQANIPQLVKGYRSHHVVGPDVNEAVGQALNYLRSLDQHRSHILADFGVDPLRASATVVIGHPKFVRGGLTEDTIVKAIRTYNSHLCRVEVITYADLVDGAERSLALSAESAEDAGEPVAIEDEYDGSDWSESDWGSDQAPF